MAKIANQRQFALRIATKGQPSVQEVERFCFASVCAVMRLDHNVNLPSDRRWNGCQFVLVSFDDGQLRLGLGFSTG